MLTFAGSRLSSRMQASDWAAKASLSSMRSRSAGLSPARASAFRVAGIGPRPITEGSTPTTALATMRASARRLIGRHHHGPALTVGDRHRHQLVGEYLLGQRHLCPPLALHRERVLIAPGDAVLSGHAFRRFTQRDGPILREGGVDEAPADVTVRHWWRGPIPRCAALEHDVGRAGHAFHPTGHEH